MLAGLGHDKPMSLLKQFGLGLLQNIQSHAASDLSSMLTGALFGTAKGGTGSDANNLVGGLLSKLFGSIFGGHRASGGGVSAGSMYIFGEHGPEAVMMGQHGYAYNHRDTRQMMGQSPNSFRFIFVDDERAAQEHFNASDRNFIHKVRRNRKLMAMNMFG